MVTLHNMWSYQHLLEIELYDPNVCDLFSNFIRFLFHSVHKFGYKSKQGWSSSQFQPASQLTTPFPRMAASASYPYPSLPLSPSLTISDGEYNPPYSPPKRNPRRATRGGSSINAAPGAMPLEQFKQEIAQVSHIITYKNIFFNIILSGCSLPAGAKDGSIGEEN